MKRQAQLVNGRASATGDDGGTPTVVTGTFDAEYNNIGHMIGAFGADKE